MKSGAVKAEERLCLCALSSTARLHTCSGGGSVLALSCVGINVTSEGLRKYCDIRST